VIGDLPAGLPDFYWPSLPAWEQFAALVAPATVIALVSSLEMASSAKIENQREGQRWNANQDLIGQGVGKWVSAFSGSFPTSASFSRSAIMLHAGARSGWSAVCAALLVLSALLMLMPALYHVPSAVLAAIVVSAVLGLIKPRLFPSLWRLQRVEAGIAITTFAATLLTTPRIYWGVLTGVVLGLAHFLHQRLHPRIVEVGLHPDGSLRDRHVWQLAPLAPHTYALRMDDALDFASASALESAIVEHLAQHPQVRHVCLFAHPINRIDATGVEVFGQLRRYLETRGVTLHVSGIKLPVEQMLQRAGALAEGPMLRLYRTDLEALEAFGRHSA
jgi:SulP family sulfate permease